MDPEKGAWHPVAGKATFTRVAETGPTGRHAASRRRPNRSSRPAPARRPKKKICQKKCRPFWRKKKYAVRSGAKNEVHKVQK